MAYALDDEDQFKRTWMPQPGQMGGMAPTGGTVGTPAASGAAAPTPPGSRFVPFERYLAANQEAAARTGEKLGYGVQQQGDQAKQAMDTGLKDFQTAAIKGMGGTYGASQNPTKTLLPPSGPASQTVQGDVVTRSAQPLTAPMYSLDEAKALAGTTYTGPTSLAEFAPGLRGQTEAAARTANQLGSEAGRRGLLTEKAAGAYGSGMSALDEALAAGTGTNRQRFQRTSDVYGKLTDWLGQREADAARTADIARTGTQKQAERFGGLVKDYEAAPDAALQASLAAAKARDAATEARNEATRGRQVAERVPLENRVTSITDENAALRYGGKTYDNWVAAGRPEFSSWIRSQGGR